MLYQLLEHPNQRQRNQKDKIILFFEELVLKFLMYTRNIDLFVCYKSKCMSISRFHPKLKKSSQFSFLGEGVGKSDYLNGMGGEIFVI